MAIFVKQISKVALYKRTLLFLEKAGRKGLSAHELGAKLKQKTVPPLELLEQAAAEGRALKKKGRFYAAAAKGLKGALMVRLNKTYGFARLFDAKENEPDIFIPGAGLHGALPGDQVLVRMLPGGEEGRPSGEITAILAKGDPEFIGIALLKRDGWQVWVDKLSQKLPLLGEPPAADRERVLVKVERRGGDHRQYALRMVKDYGPADEAKSAAAAILDAAGIVPDFPLAAQDEARCLAHRGLPEGELAGRLDLRDWDIFTIDGADAKDLDDAVSVSRTKTGWLLGVHIADVSHYVRPGSALDREAFSRGVSVYYAREVVPMLPRELSNGICSLNPGEDRLCFSALMELDADGALYRWQFQKSVIRSRIKGVYGEINRIFAGEAEGMLREKYAPVMDELSVIRELGAILRRRQQARGSLDIQSAECKITTGEDGKVLDIAPRQSGEAERVIESFMLLANEAAARLAAEANLPFVYRVHGRPAPEKVEQLKGVLKALGEDLSPLRAEPPATVAFAAVLRNAAGKPVENAVHWQVLRTMAKACYNARPLGHYGLALSDYAHFTSPIRRYPDLAVHRVLTAYLEGGGLPRQYRDFAVRTAKQASLTEANAASAERACEDCYKAEYMGSRIGLACDGVISGVAAHGVYVTIYGCIEGMVPAGVLPQGEYLFDGGLELMEARTRRRYRLGEPLRVVCTSVDIPTGKILLDLA